MKNDEIKDKALVKMIKLYKCIQVVECKFAGLPVDDMVSEGIKRDMGIAMDTVDSSLRDNFYTSIEEKDGKTIVDVIDKTTGEPATGDRLFEVLKESVINEEE